MAAGTSTRIVKEFGTRKTTAAPRPLQLRRRRRDGSQAKLPAGKRETIYKRYFFRTRADYREFVLKGENSPLGLHLFKPIRGSSPATGVVDSDAGSDKLPGSSSFELWPLSEAAMAWTGDGVGRPGKRLLSSSLK